MKNNFYVDFHVLQNVPPSCINRDDTGSPKTAKYGGAVRARVSSQSWKHEMRKMFKEMFGDVNIGIRTKQVPRMIADEMKKIDSSIDDEKALDIIKMAFTEKINNKKNAKYVGTELPIDKANPNEIKSLMFFNKEQAKAVAELLVVGSKDKDDYKKALNDMPTIDMTLFGRMVASATYLNYDAAAQVAHVISTHAVHNEYDYFTAIDDCKKEESGAGHLGTVEFNSSVLYRYATVNVTELQNTIKRLTANFTAEEAVKGFAEAFVRTMPTGKQNTFANRTMPDYVYISVRTDQPVNLCGAFEKPVTSTEGYLEKSIERFECYSEEVYKKYACAPEKVWILGDKSLPEILEELEAFVKEKTSESEGE